MPESLETRTAEIFPGTLVAVVLRRAAKPDSREFLVEFPVLETRAGQVFLTGRRAVLYHGEWSSRTQVAIQWSAVVSYIVFESRDDYFQRGLAARKTMKSKRGTSGPGHLLLSVAPETP